MKRAIPSGFLGWLGVAVLLGAAVYCAVASLPFWRYHLFGAPAPGSAPRYRGEISLVGQDRMTRRGWIPQKYFIQTESGPVELKCGFWPNYRFCPFDQPNSNEIYEVGFDRYWGVDYIKYPPSKGEAYVWSGDKVDEIRSRYVEKHFYYSLGFMFFLVCGAVNVKKATCKGPKRKLQG